MEADAVDGRTGDKQRIAVLLAPTYDGTIGNISAVPGDPDTLLHQHFVLRTQDFLPTKRDQCATKIRANLSWMNAVEQGVVGHGIPGRTRDPEWCPIRLMSVPVLWCPRRNCATAREFEHVVHGSLPGVRPDPLLEWFSVLAQDAQLAVLLVDVQANMIRGWPP